MDSYPVSLSIFLFCSPRTLSRTASIVYVSFPWLASVLWLTGGAHTIHNAQIISDWHCSGKSHCEPKVILIYKNEDVLPFDLCRAYRSERFRLLWLSVETNCTPSGPSPFDVKMSAYSCGSRYTSPLSSWLRLDVRRKSGGCLGSHGFHGLSLTHT